MNLIFCIMAIAFALMGMLIRIGKGDFLLVGFVRDLKKKKAYYDMDLLCRFVAKVLYLCAVTFAIMSLGVVLEMKMVTWIGIVLFFGVMVYSAKYTEDETRFRKGGAK